MRETFFKKKTFSKGEHLSKNFPQFYSSSSGPGCSSTGGALVTFSYLILFVFPKAIWKLPSIPLVSFDI